MKQKKLAQAVTIALLSTAAVSTASATSTTMYNKFTTGSTGDTDGWVWGGIGVGTPKPVPTTPNPSASALANPGFVGTADSNNDGYGDTPFGYVGSSHLNWGARLDAAGDSLQISQADANARYGFAAEIDTGAGAWLDDGSSGFGKVTGWKHQTDIGIIQVLEDMQISIAASVVGGTPFSNFGMTVFEGIDSNTGNYSHHGPWNTLVASTASDPFGTSGLTYMKHDGTVDLSNVFTFNAQAGKTYSLYLGGAGVGDWAANVGDYQLDITTSPVPVPAAVWLFGSSLMGLVGFSKRRKGLVG